MFFVHGAFSLGFCESILHVVSGFVFALIEFILCIIGEYLRFWNLFHRLVAIVNGLSTLFNCLGL